MSDSTNPPLSEIEQLAALCERLGAPPRQAATMAAQLLKRAEQIARERGQTHEAALRRLLELMVQGRAGEVPEEFKPPTISQEKSEKDAQAKKEPEEKRGEG